MAVSWRRCSGRRAAASCASRAKLPHSMVLCFPHQMGTPEACHAPTPHQAAQAGVMPCPPKMHLPVPPEHAEKHLAKQQDVHPCSSGRGRCSRHKPSPSSQAPAADRAAAAAPSAWTEIPSRLQSAAARPCRCRSERVSARRSQYPRCRCSAGSTHSKTSPCHSGPTCATSQWRTSACAATRCPGAVSEALIQPTHHAGPHNGGQTYCR
mmetsp:Transcript_155916/g.283582  ORF Transcript_155916/g.283582 Transcript_155916/m.283582 type:complete len:209 (-) Transcript_155916:1189-1815(-)